MGVIKYFNNQATGDNQLNHIIVFGEEEISWKLLELLKLDLQSDVSLWTDWINFNELFSDYYADKEVIMSLSKAIGSTIRRIAP